MKQDILNLNNENVGSIELNDAIFGLEVSQATFRWMLTIFMGMLVADAFTQLHYKQVITLPIAMGR